MAITIKHSGALYEMNTRGRVGVLTKIDLPKTAIDLDTNQHFDVAADGQLKARLPDEDEMVAWLTAHVKSNNEAGAFAALTRVWSKLSVGLRGRAAHAYALKAGVPVIRLPS